MIKIQTADFRLAKSLPSDETIDCRSGVPNPHNVGAFKYMNGKHEPVQKYVGDSERAQRIMKNVLRNIDLALARS